MDLSSLANNNTFWTFISFLPTIIFCIIVLAQFIAGFRRGKVKSIKLFINFLLAIVCATIFFFILRKNFDTYAISIGDPILNKFNTSWQNILSTTKSYNTLSEYFEEYLSNNEQFVNAIQNQGLTISETVKMLYSTSLLIVNLILFLVCVVVYFIAKAILYIVYLIFFKESRRKKKINKAYEEKKRDKPYKKYKFQGSLIGLFRGLVIAIFCVSPFGIINCAISNGEVIDLSSNSEDSNETKIAYEVIKAFSKYDTTGVGVVLNKVKNKEGLPLYLIVADKLTSTSYTYTNESGEEETLTLSLTKDLAPLTSATCKTALLFLQYGYDITYSYSSEELAEFITSDKEIDGKTLEEAVSETLEGLSVEENTMLSYSLNMFAICYAQITVGEDVNEDNINNQELSKRLLYHAFIGKNSLTATEIVSGNLDTAFNLFVDYVKYKDTIDTIGNVFNNANQEKLAYGISKTLKSSDTSLGQKAAEVIYEDLSSLSFFDSEKFNNLLTDCICDILNAYIPDFDFTLTTSNTLYDIDWSTSLKEVFDLAGALIDNVVNNSLESTSDLMHFYINQLSDNTSEVYNRLNNVIDTSALSIILNTKGFNNFIETTINDSLKSLTSKEITLVSTNWGNYTDEFDVVHDGEFKRLLNTMVPTLAAVFNVTYQKESLSNDDVVQIIDILTNPQSYVYNVIDDSNNNYSIVMHSLLSDIISSVEIEVEEDKPINLYIESNDKTLISDKYIIKSEPFKELLTFVYNNESSVPSLLDGSIDYLTFAHDNISNIKSSSILKSVSSMLIYEFGKSYLTIPSRISLSQDVIDTNIEMWTKEDGELTQILNSFDKEFDLISDVKNGVDTANVIASILKSDDSTIEVLTSSIIINATITKKLVEEANESNFVIGIPNYAYQNSYLDTIKVSEYKALVNYLKCLFNINDETKSVEFTSLNYNDVIKEEAINLMQNTSIGIVSVAFWFKNHVITDSSVKDYLEIPDTYISDLTNNTIITSFETSPWKSETKNLLEGVSLIGVKFGNSNEISIDLRNVFYLSDNLESDSTKTKLAKLYESTILSHSLTKTINTINDLYVPQNAYDSESIIKEEELENAIKSFKELINAHLEDSNFEIENIKSYIDLSAYSNSIDSLVDIVKPNIVSASIAQMIINQDGVELPTDYSFDKTNETNINKWLYSDTSNGETINLIKAINIMGLLDKVTDASGFNSIDSNLILKADGNMDVLLESQIVWYMMSNKMFGLTSITITENDTDIINSQVYISKTEFTNYVSAMVSLAIDNDLENINIDSNNAYKHIDKVIQSSIARTMLTSEVEKHNTIVMKRVSVTDNSENIYANTYKTYNQNKELTDTTVNQLTKEESKSFLEVVHDVFGDEGTSYNIDYTSITVTSANISYLESSVVLNGLQYNLKIAINYYNASHKDDLVTLSKDYTYYLADNTILDDYISYEEAKTFVNKL